MSLPGKLCVGILEEDNPLRSYFRFKPLLVEENGRYVSYTEADQYPDEGCIRIVPDKNESYYFKSRMRQNGLFSVVDLRDHPNENDKIRPNKNYRPGGEEINANIIYSDVVRAPAADMIYQLLPAEALEAPLIQPHTARVLIRKPEGVDPVCHEWKLTDEEKGLGTLTPTETRCAVGDFQAFDIPDFRGETLSFLIKPAALMVSVCDTASHVPQKGEAHHGASEKPAHEKATSEKPTSEKPTSEKPASEKPAQEKAAPEKPAQEKPAQDAPKPEEKPRAKAADASPKAEEKAAAPGARTAPPQPTPPKAETPERTEKASAPAAVGGVAEDKPWIHRDAQMQPQPIDRRMSRTEQLLAAQAGLNPRRGRSLQELIDEKWQRSRLNQLGIPVSPIATGAPVRNPVDAAVESVRELWSDPHMRQELLNALAHLDSFSDQLNRRREIAMQSAAADQLNAMEAQRLELLTELDRIKEGNRQLREQLKQEIRRDEANALAEAVEKTRAAEAERQRFEKLADDARLAAADAQNALDSLVGDRLEDKIRDVALTRRVMERLDFLNAGVQRAAVPPAAERLGFNALIDRVEKRLAAAGWRWSHEDAANLCACLVLSPVLLISGGPGSGKTTCAQMLADALGLSGVERVAVCPPDAAPLRKDARVHELLRFPESPAMLILDDANLAPTPDLLRGMTQALRPEWRVVVTLQDAHSGAPLSAHALDRGFMVRLTVPEHAPWQPPAREAVAAETLASIESVRTSMPRAEVPQALIARMDALRGEMARCGAPLSRRALDETWRYCSTMTALLGKAVDVDALFDRVAAQRLLPATLAAAPLEAALRLRALVGDLPLCGAWLNAQLPIGL